MLCMIGGTFRSEGTQPHPPMMKYIDTALPTLSDNAYSDTLLTVTDPLIVTYPIIGTSTYSDTLLTMTHCIQ